MKKYIFLLTLLTMLSLRGFSQEQYGHSLNLGLGVGYYGHIGHPVPVAHLNYEFDVVKNLTLAPFVSLYAYGEDYYYGNQYYAYRAVVMPIGVKSAYYFDDLLNASDKWDFYVGGSLGVNIYNAHWDADYPGNKNVYNNPPSLYIALHAGAEYHFNPKMGAFLDLSTGVSTIGLAFHKPK